MKVIGLLGGMSWESTATYYRLINEGIKNKLGGLHSAKIVLVSVDFNEIEKLQVIGDWTSAAKILGNAALNVQKAGANFLLICTNTMHKVAAEIEAVIDIPLLHIADATAEVLKSNNIRKVGLLGTAFTMEQEFYKGRLENKHHLDVIVPDAIDRKKVHDVIYQELCLGKVSKESKSNYLGIVDKMIAAGAEGIILGCTEIGLLIKNGDASVTLFDTTKVHAEKAIDFSLR